MSREVLHNPQTPILPPDAGEAAKRRAVDKFGNTQRGREVAVEPDGPAVAPGTARAAPAPAREARATAAPAPGPGAPPAPFLAPPAHQAAYFTEDVVATGRPSPHARAQRALRGSQEITDLKKVVLPAGAADTVSPQVLAQVGERMALAGGPANLDVRDLFARLGAWAQGTHMTVERLQGRLAQLEGMVEARRRALARMSELRRRRAAGALDPEAYEEQAGADEDDADEALAASGNRRMHGAHARADGMHRRLARVLGLR